MSVCGSKYFVHFQSAIPVTDPQTRKVSCLKIYRQLASITYQWYRQSGSIEGIHMKTPYFTFMSYKNAEIVSPYQGAGASPLSTPKYASYYLLEKTDFLVSSAWFW